MRLELNRGEPALLEKDDTEGWQPLHIAEMHQRCAAHKLRQIATANLPQLVEQLLPEPLRSQVSAEPDPLIRQTLIDLTCARGFRSDLFARGSAGLHPEAWRRRVGGLRLHRCEAPARQEWRFATGFGELSVPGAICEAMEAALGQGPRTLAELAEAIGQPSMAVLRVAGPLLETTRLGFDRGEAAAPAQSVCERVNALLTQRISEGWNDRSLAAQAVGSAIECNLIEALCCLAPPPRPPRSEGRALGDGTAERARRHARGQGQQRR